MSNIGDAIAPLTRVFLVAQHRATGEAPYWIYRTEAAAKAAELKLKRETWEFMLLNEMIKTPCPESDEEMVNKYDDCVIDAHKDGWDYATEIQGIDIEEAPGPEIYTEAQVLQMIKNVAQAFVKMQEDCPPFYGAKLEYLCRMAPVIVAIEEHCPPDIDWKALVDEYIAADLVARGLMADDEVKQAAE